MADVFDEVDDELREERLKRRVKQYGPWVAGALFLALAAAGAWTVWQNVQENRQMERTEALTQAIQAAQSSDSSQSATEKLDKFRKRHGGPIASLATLHLASSLVEKGKTDRAEKLYGQLAKQSGSGMYANLGAVLNGLHRFDTASPKALRVALAPVLNDKSPWRFTARWLVAHRLLRAGQTEEAGKLFTRLSEAKEAPASLQRRVQPFAERYGG